MKSSQDISNQIRSQLKVIDPDFSAEPLTPERKIIDTVAEVIAGSQADQYTLQYQFDIDSKVGYDLDKFIALFGFARQSGNRATGLVTFYTSDKAPQDIYIPVGTQISTSSSSITSSVVFTTTSSTVIYKDTDSATTTIQAVNVGTAGNVPANVISSYLGSQSTLVAGAYNDLPTSGGTNPETDADLRLRFKNTVFRNIAGTKDQFLSIALSSDYTTKAIIIGAEDEFREIVQFPVVETGDSIAKSQIPYSKFTYNFDYYVIQNSSGSDVFFNPATDYTFNPTGATPVTDSSGNIIVGAVAPSITLVNEHPDSDFQQGSSVLFQHTYNSINSRNIPASGILNYIDVYVQGDNPLNASESTMLPLFSGPQSQLLTTITGSQYFVGNFRVAQDRSTPQAGYLYQNLLWQPITALPDNIIIANSAYSINNDYFFVEDITINRGSKLAKDGIIWNPAAYQAISALPTVSGTYAIEYEFNNLPIALNQIMDQYKQVTTDVLVHSANKRYFKIFLTVMYTNGYTQSVVNSNIYTDLSNYFASLDFGEVIQFSDILQVAHNVSGVDNVRISISSDGAGYGVIELAPDLITQVGSVLTNDFSLSDIDVAILSDIVVTPKAQNTWKTGT